MKKLLQIVILLAIGGIMRPAAAQFLHSGYLELGGPGLISLNVERRLTHETNGLGLRVGAGAVIGFSDATAGTILALPVGVNYLIGQKETNLLELGAGITCIRANNTPLKGDFQGTFGHFLAGYRFQPRESNFMFRVFISPIFGINGWKPAYGGVSIGMRFKNPKTTRAL